MKNEKQHITFELEELEAKNLKKLKEAQELPADLFFEEMQAAVFEEIKTEKQGSRKKISRWIPLAMAASLVLLIGLSFFNTQETETDYWSAVSNSELETYVAENLEDFADDELLASVSNTDFSILSNTNIPIEDLSEYLLDSDLDEEEFYPF